jgi:hypothetical protein
MRNEFEKEVKRLQDEILHLKQENKHLKADKEHIEQQFVDFKIKHETIVTRLRGKIAEVALAKPMPSEGTGKIYHQTSQSPSKLIVHQKASIMAINGFHNPHHQPHSLPPPPPPAPPLPQENEGFRVPTVSELMRRSTVEHPEFKESLRRNQTNTTASAATLTKDQAVTNKSNKPQQQGGGGGKPGDQYQQHAHNTPNELMMSHQLMYDVPQPLQQQQQSHQQMKSPNFNAGIPPPPSFSQQSQPSAGERGGPPTNSNANVGGTSKSLNRTLSYFDATFMKGNNVQSILDPKEAVQSNNNNNNNNNNINNSNAADSSLHRAQGSMYSIANNYPAFGGGNNNNYNNNTDYDSSPDNTTRHNNNNNNTRKMSVPMDSAYSDLAGANHMDYPVVEIDLT